MRRSILSIAAVGALSLAACTPAEVVVNAEIEQADAAAGEGATTTLQLQNMVVELIPFDRDQIFDSLAAAAPNPEPEIPPDILAAQEQIAEARDAWQSLETRWNTLRDTLTTLNEEMQQYSQGEGRYVTLYNEWQDLDAEYQRVDRARQAAFQRFDSLTQANLAQAEEIRIQRDNWADEAFAEAAEVWAAYERQAGRDVMVDTTSADGIARFSGMPAGQWWVHARYEGPSTEYYWNVPIEVPKGETVQIALTRTNAEQRPKL